MKRFAKLWAVIVLVTVSVGCGDTLDEPKKEATADALPIGKVEETDDVAPPEILFQIRHPHNRGDAVRIRLDTDRLRAYGLSKEDVMKALTPSGLVDPKEPLPPSGVVFDTHLAKPDRYENVILKANDEGHIVRLKDVAKVELLANREAQETKPDIAADGGRK